MWRIVPLSSFEGKILFFDRMSLGRPGDPFSGNDFRQIMRTPLPKTPGCAYLGKEICAPDGQSVAEFICWEDFVYSGGSPIRYLHDGCDLIVNQVSEIVGLIAYRWYEKNLNIIFAVMFKETSEENLRNLFCVFESFTHRKLAIFDSITIYVYPDNPFKSIYPARNSETFAVKIEPPTGNKIYTGLIVTRIN
jgi:hypothetical protein